MPRYDFICMTCSNVIEVKRTIKNRNRITYACREVRGLDEEPCGGKLVRKYTPAAFRVNSE